MTQTKKNFLYNILYQILTLVLPLITVPYVSRTLGAENIGIYSYTYSIVYYFMLIAMLGINNYGNRTIAQCRDNKEKRSRNFLGIYAIQIILSIIMSVFYIIYIIFFQNKYKLISTIQIIYLISNAFDINWFFFGLERCKITVTRNIIIKILSLVCILLFVKDKNDLIIYTLILSCNSLISQLLLFPFLKREIKWIKLRWNDIFKHIKPCIILFVPVIAISIYKVMDKIMIEKLANVKEVGYYEQAEKIIGIPLGIITALGTVMLPKISNLLQKNEIKIIREYIKKSVSFMFFLAFPLCMGIIAVSRNAVIVLLGEEFIKSIYILRLLSVTIIFISFANILRTQYLIPREEDKIYIKSVFIGAITNLIMNFAFIPLYGGTGACIGTIVAEFAVMLYQAITIRKKLPIREYIINGVPFFIKSIIMLSIIYPINYINMSRILKLIFQVGLGCLTYVLLNYKYILSIVDLNIIKNKLKKNDKR